MRRLPDGDVLLGHASWEDFVEQIRVFKHVDLGPVFPDEDEGGDYTLSYSSYAGLVGSSDDWLLARRSGLAVSETSLSSLDSTAFAALSP